ncbi:hypothetical protein ACWGSK_18965 [Nocardiopsis sp. NPDC055551]|uniref:hypothetical protein n=1 Tax=Nocardiopsis sp. NPDC006832 TaxID=3157188 RepID=UPI0033EFF60B
MTRTPALLSAGAFSLVLMLTACGNDPAEEETTVSTEKQEEEGGGSPKDLLAQVFDSTTEITNYTLDIDMTAPDVEMGILYEVMNDPVATQATMSMPLMGEMMFELMSMGGELPDGVTAEDLSTYIVIFEEGSDPLVADTYGLQGDAPWIRGDASTMEQNPSDAFDIESLPDLVAAFATLDQIEETGTEEVGGIETTVLQGSMTEEEINALDAEQKLAVIELLGSVSGTLDVSLAVSDDGFPMRIDFSDDQADVTMEFSEIGSTSFEIPAEEQIG